MWTYDVHRGLRVYDPYGHDKLSAHIKKEATKMGVIAQVITMGQQPDKDFWSCGYRVIKWVVMSAFHAPPGEHWMDNIRTPLIKQQWPELLEKIDDLNNTEDETETPKDKDLTTRKIWKDHPLMYNDRNTELSNHHMIQQVHGVYEEISMDWVRRAEEKKRERMGETQGITGTWSIEEVQTSPPHASHPHHLPYPHSHPPTHHHPTPHLHAHDMRAPGAQTPGHIPPSTQSIIKPLNGPKHEAMPGEPDQKKRPRGTEWGLTDSAQETQPEAKRAKTEKWPTPASTKRQRAGEEGARGPHEHEPQIKRAKYTGGVDSPKRPRPAPDESGAEGIRRGGNRRAPFRDITVQANRDDLGGVPNPDPEPQEEGKGVG
jgi:hypothetical protein